MNPLDNLTDWQLKLVAAAIILLPLWLSAILAPILKACEGD